MSDMTAGEFISGCIGAAAIWWIVGSAIYGFWRGISGQLDDD